MTKYLIRTKGNNVTTVTRDGTEIEMNARRTLANPLFCLQRNSEGMFNIAYSILCDRFSQELAALYYQEFAYQFMNGGENGDEPITISDKQIDDFITPLSSAHQQTQNIMQRVKPMLCIIIAIGFGLLSTIGCVSPMQVSQSRTFALSIDTPITVDVPNDRDGIQGRVEAKLLDLGLNVVPIDVARRTAELNQNIQFKDSSIDANSSIERKVYYPSALVVTISYRTRTDAFMAGFVHFNARFLDLKTERVLGVASFSQGTNWVSIDYSLNSFARQMKSYVRNE